MMHGCFFRTATGVLAALLLAAAPALGGTSDGAKIVNSGSTNARGWTILVWSARGGEFYVVGSRSSIRRFPSASTAARFFADVKAARSERAVGGGCMKSASFGTRTWVYWHNWQSADVSCPTFGAANRALAADVAAIQAAANVTASQPSRLIRIPSEPRRAEAPNPVPTP